MNTCSRVLNLSLLAALVCTAPRDLRAQPMGLTWSDFTGPMTLLGRHKSSDPSGSAAARRVMVSSLASSARHSRNRAVTVLLSPDGAVREALLTAFADAPGAPPRATVAEFVASYSAMGPEPTQQSVAEAITRYNAMIQRAQSAFLATPVLELSAVRDVLQELLQTQRVK